MDEKQVIKLLSLVVQSLLDSSQERRSDRVAEEIAEAAWDGLVLLLRESLLQQRKGEVLLDGLGHFTQLGDFWVFRPAVAFAEIEALKLQPEEGQGLLARRAVSLLRQGVSLLDLVSEDVEVTKGEWASREEEILTKIFDKAAAAKGRLLSEKITSLISLLTKKNQLLKVNVAPGEGTFESLQLGKTYTGTVVRVEPYGAFVKISPGIEGLVHISELAPYRVSEVSDLVQLGDHMEVKVINIDERGRVRLSRKAVIMEEPGYEEEQSLRTEEREGLQR